MIALLWSRISYMAQLLGACLIFMAPARKRKQYPLRAALFAAVLLTTSYWINVLFSELELGWGLLLYWAVFLVLCVPFVWFCIDVTLVEVVYCTTCASAMQHIAYDLCEAFRLLVRDVPLAYLAIYVSIYLLFARSFVQKIAGTDGYRISRADLFPVLTIILFVLLLSTWNRGSVNTAEELLHCVIFIFSDALCCFYVLWQQSSQREKLDLQRELDGINHILHQQQMQFQITQDTIDTINRKCHDLRHQVRALAQTANGAEKERYLQEIEEAIDIYDTAVKTGNTALDVVLMEKGLFCKSHDIQWTCMADGSKLSFMALEDIYSVFGNALDNAIAAVMALDDPQKRLISLRIMTQDQVMIIQIQNYYEGQLHFADGLPTTRQDWHMHGYGMKSIRYTAEKYNGTISVTANAPIFTLQILIPLGIQEDTKADQRHD